MGGLKSLSVVLPSTRRSKFRSSRSRDPRSQSQTLMGSIAASTTMKCSSTLEGDDLRKFPLHLRHTHSAGSWPAAPPCHPRSPYEQGEIGPELFRAVCGMMLGLSPHTAKADTALFVAGLDQGEESGFAPDEPCVGRVSSVDPKTPWPVALLLQRGDRLSYYGPAFYRSHRRVSRGHI